MRIISGKYRNHKLTTIVGNSTRPTSDYNREMIFSVYPDYQGKKVLDLYAGSGSFGLEALSRGAKWVDFVEFAQSALGMMLSNIEKLRCGEYCHVYRRKVESYLKKCDSKYDLIFLDPPYEKGLLNTTLRAIYAAGILEPDGVIIAEHSVKEDLAKDFQQDLITEKRGKTVCFSLLKPSTTENNQEHI
ncbi:MAG: 16S rRNA (guanine(966)-N(2))-methyltransferase RsmD [Candidatus Cloacimonetes bacterium]|nr:16S rRNA (guanine(966)-N(2))-methyltransferase RsmD [Candidatus Cloacimonadota bacterium]